jgi:hypothetical protein
MPVQHAGAEGHLYLVQLHTGQGDDDGKHLVGLKDVAPLQGVACARWKNWRWRRSARSIASQACAHINASSWLIGIIGSERRGPPGMGRIASYST